jgi:hypothetical protein
LIVSMRTSSAQFATDLIKREALRTLPSRLE